MRPENGANRIAKICGNREVTLLIKGGRRQAGPFAIYLAAAHRTAHHPHHIAMSVISSGVAVFPYRASELRNHQHHRVLILRTQRLCKAGLPRGELREVRGELSPGRLPGLRACPIRALQKRDPDRRIAADEMSQPVSVVRESLWRRGPRICLGHIGLQIRHQLRARCAAFPVGDAQCIRAAVQSVKCRFDHWSVQRQGTRGGASQRQVKDRQFAV